MAKTLEDIVKKSKVPVSQKSKKPKEKNWDLGTIVKDIAKYSPIGIASFLIGGPSSLIVAGGFGLGHLVEKSRNKEKTNWKGLFKELYTGNIFGTFVAGAYGAAQLIPNTTLEGKVARFLVFNPLIISGFNYLYRNFVYLRDKVGWGDVATGIANGELSTHMKKAHEEDIKPNYMRSNVMNFFALGPIQFFNLNYIPDSMIPLKVALGTVNSFIFRLIGGAKKSAKVDKPYPKLDDYRKPDTYRNAA